MIKIYAFLLCTISTSIFAQCEPNVWVRTNLGKGVTNEPYYGDPVLAIGKPHQKLVSRIINLPLDSKREIVKKIIGVKPSSESSLRVDWLLKDHGSETAIILDYYRGCMTGLAIFNNISRQYFLRTTK